MAAQADGSVPRWIGDLKAGGNSAAQYPIGPTPPGGPVGRPGSRIIRPRRRIVMVMPVMHLQIEILAVSRLVGMRSDQRRLIEPLGRRCARAARSRSAQFWDLEPPDKGLSRW
jgi:hypothetical protein